MAHLANADRVSNQQFDHLVDHMEQHPALAKGVGVGPRGRENFEQQWDELAVQLNSYGCGATKAGKRWKSYWTDLKSKVKRRALDQKNHAIGTGGGPPIKGDLKPWEERILTILGPEAVFGDAQHRVPLLKPQSLREDKAYEILREHTDLSLSTQESYEEIRIQTDISASAAGGSTDNNENVLQIVTDISPSAGDYTLEIGDDQSMLTPAPLTLQPQLSQLKNSPLTTPRIPIKRPRSQKNLAPPQKKSASKSIGQRTKVESAWVVELEERRVAAEEKIANAAMILAEAAQIQAQASLQQAQASLQQAQVAEIQNRNIEKLGDALLEIIKKV